MPAVSQSGKFVCHKTREKKNKIYNINFEIPEIYYHYFWQCCKPLSILHININVKFWKLLFMKIFYTISKIFIITIIFKTQNWQLVLRRDRSSVTSRWNHVWTGMFLCLPACSFAMFWCFRSSFFHSRREQIVFKKIFKKSNPLYFWDPQNE